MWSALLAVALWMGDTPRAPFGERELERTCGTCHPMDPIRAAKLSREDWGLELDKMQTIGAKIRNRRVLLDYLAAHYGPGKPATVIRQ